MEMLYFKSPLFYFLILICWSSCQNEIGTSTPSYELPDLSQFYESEVERLKQTPTMVVSQIMVSDAIETVTDSFPNWAEILFLLSKYNINKPALIENYAVDSTVFGDIKHLFIEKISGDFEVEHIHMMYQQQEIELIEIQAITNNWLKTENITFSYQPHKAFTLKIKRKGLMYTEKEKEVWGEFVIPPSQD
jgi:hypothetical protein